MSTPLIYTVENKKNNLPNYIFKADNLIDNISVGPGFVTSGACSPMTMEDRSGDPVILNSLISP